MSRFKLDFSIDELEKDLELEKSKLVRIEDLDDSELEKLNSEKDFKMHTEDINGLEQPLNNEHMRPALGWGGKAFAGINMNYGSEGAQKPNNIQIRVHEKEVYIFLTGRDENIISLYPLFINADPSVITDIHLFLTDGFGFFEETTFLQTAILDCKSKVHTHVAMISNCRIDSNVFFISIYADEIHPIPYDVISLTEPVTYMDGMGRLTSDVKYYSDVRTSILTNWYEYAMYRKILSSEDVLRLNSGETLIITDINKRLSEANKIGKLK